jgi:hypothetical protein
MIERHACFFTAGGPDHQRLFMDMRYHQPAIEHALQAHGMRGFVAVRASKYPGAVMPRALNYRGSPCMEFHVYRAVRFLIE